MFINRMPKFQELNTDNKERIILQRWNQYNGEFQKKRKRQPSIHTIIERPEIFASDIITVNIEQSESVYIIIDIQSALDDFGNENITEIINELYDYGVILEYLSSCLLPKVPRKASRNEFKLHRTISQISQITMCII